MRGMEKELLKPRALRPGQTVGLVAASSALADIESLWRGVARLEAMGYKVRVSDGCSAWHGYLAGPDRLRAAEVNAMFADDTVDAIMCARGGYGATRILGEINYDVIHRNPKLFCGFSDVTALHSAIQRHAGLVTFHGPMASPDFGQETVDDFSVEAFLRLAGRVEPGGLLDNPPDYPRHMVRPGIAEGRLIGGNLMLVTACLGTPYAWDFDDAILFLEEVNERSYAVDRMLVQLRAAGVFQRVAGVLLGAFTNCEPEEGASDLTVAESVEEVLGACRVPVLAGLQCGHVVPRMTLPLGVRCRMDADAGTVEVLEAAVR